MQRVIEEIRDLMEDNLNPTDTAESGTTGTNLKMTAHGLVTGDYIINRSRSDAIRQVTVVDDDNLTVADVTGQTSGDTIEIWQFKKFYAGFVDYDQVPVNHADVLMVYGTATTTDRPATNKDRSVYSLEIKVLVNAYNKINAATGPEADQILMAQKRIKEVMEGRGTDGVASANSILGLLRRNIAGTNYLFTKDYSIEYGSEPKNIAGSIWFSAIMKLTAVTDYNLRS